MRIGIVPGLIASDGGIYQYSLNMIRAIAEAKRDGCDDEFIVYADPNDPAFAGLDLHGLEFRSILPLTIKRRAFRTLGQLTGGIATRTLAGLRKTRRQVPVRDCDSVVPRKEFKRWFERNGTKLVLYPISTTLSFEAGVPYIMAIHDLQHRLQPEFPEVSANGEWEYREYLFRNAIRNATLLLADSETGKEDILSFYGEYGVTEDRIKVLPLIPACTLAPEITETEQQRIYQKYSLPERYFFYPAQFWPHKNHVGIVEALGLLRERHGLKIPIAFCGSHSGAIREQVFNEVKAAAARLDLATEIHYLGYVPDADMSGLYAGAAALIMPTFFGPSNTPVVEAWESSCPVLTSDIRGIREQAGDAAILVDPRSVEAIAEGINRLWTNENLRRTLAERGRERLRAFTPNDFRVRLMQILEEAKAILDNDNAEGPFVSR